MNISKRIVHNDRILTASLNQRNKIDTKIFDELREMLSIAGESPLTIRLSKIIEQRELLQKDVSRLLDQSLQISATLSFDDEETN